MSTDDEGESPFGKILARIKEVEGTEKDKDVAKALGLDQRDLSSRKVSGAVPYKRIVEYSRSHHVSLEYLLNGRGPLRSTDMVQDPGSIYRVGTDVDVLYQIAAAVYQALLELGATIEPDKFARVVRLLHRNMIDSGNNTIAYPHVREVVKLAL